MELNNEIWPLIGLIHNKNNINPTPEYQRYSVWNRKQQQLLMDSIYQGMDIPKLYLRKTADGSDFKYEAVDGQQRMRAIWDFYANEYALNKDFTPDLGGQRYDQLEMETRQIFDMFNFSVVIIRDASDAEIREMFCRLQNGKPLNAAEKRNAMASDMRDFCATLAKHPFFGSVAFTDGRMQHQQLAAQCVLLEIEGKATNIRDSRLNGMYTEHQSFSDNGKVAKKSKKVFDYMHACFPEKTHELKRGLSVSIYLLLSQLMEEYNLSGKEDAFKSFLLDFEHRRRSAKNDSDFLNYERHTSKSSDGEEAIAYRHEMLLRDFHAFVPDLIPLDSQRGFDATQRLVIFRRDGGACKYCGSDVPWDDFHADHVVAHSQGGPTTVDNGWLACSKCNTKKGASPVGQVL
ncbi:HNH endonuclease [Rosistilla oblonga]|uniref:GmrSD restriction endonuclease domain-containing protein n=1 Tax=Rosistilla oblonga TaxID=2527990 RepID=UPI001188B7DF|nr:DUF262 domain-containing protein [Rosistilla oblonga]QDV11476.1 HNH endonuclease [Rosistilla oblonga]